MVLNLSKSVGEEIELLELVLGDVNNLGCRMLRSLTDDDESVCQV